jgi:hypothetical protein
VPFPRSFLDICIVFPDLDNPKTEENIALLLENWKGKSWIDEDFKAEKDGLLDGSFQLILVEPPTEIFLYANHQGGYRVLCPKLDQSIVHEFTKAVSQWRRGGERHLSCSACGEIHGLEDVILKPNGRFSKGAIILKNVSSIALSEEAKLDIEQHLGEVDFVYKRIG